MNSRYWFLGAAAAGALLASASASALPILQGSDGGGGLWSASDTEGRSATAQFSATSDGFQIVLTSLASATSAPNEVLAGLFFGFADGYDPGIADPGSDGLTNVDANAIGSAGDSLTETYGVDHGTNLDGEWGFRAGIDGDNGGRGEYGISGTAYDPFGFSEVIDSAYAYKPPMSPNGAEFGIAAGDLSGLAASVDFWAQDFVTLRFVTAGTFDHRHVDEVHFLYGTDFETARVPEPATLGLLGIGGLLLGVGVRRGRRRTA